jgi:hypothetical protein
MSAQWSWCSRAPSVQDLYFPLVEFPTALPPLETKAVSWGPGGAGLTKAVFAGRPRSLALGDRGNHTNVHHATPLDHPTSLAHATFPAHAISLAPEAQCSLAPRFSVGNADALQREVP